MHKFLFVVSVVVFSSLTAESRSRRQKRQLDPFGGGGGGDPFGGGGGGDPFGGGGNPDPYAQQGTSKCHPLQAPANAKVECHPFSDSSPFYHCIATADAGYQFRDGDRSKQKDCDSQTGNFFGGNQFEPVFPICDPPCQHHGACVLPDTCACTAGWKGAKCEIAAALCEDPVSPQGGSIQCHQGASVKECTVTCQPGFRFEYQPSDKYTCAADGTWSPARSTIPNCIPDQPTRTRDAMCAAWGQDHYRTFDGTVYSFQGQCEYLLAKDAKSGTFHVHLINDKKCDPHSECKREIDVYIGQDIVNFRVVGTGPVIYYNKFPLTIPTSRDGNTFTRLGRYYVMKSPLGFMIRWDGRQSVFMSVTGDHKGGIKGLCGTYNGNKGDDFTTDTGKVVTSASSFASTWKKSAINAAVCPDSPQKTCTGAQETDANNVCNKIMDPTFKPCHGTIDPTPYKEACKSDCCGGDLAKCSCSGLEAYGRACLDAGIVLNWRSNQLCPVSCPNNLVHMECGSSCQKTCTSVGTTCQDTSCVDGCFCPHGMVLNAGKCIMADQCPCTKPDGTEYHAGQVIPKDCNSCKCTSGGIWQCTQKKCEATCSATGDPHYMTFDGKRYNFMGICTYYLMKDSNFNIAVENIKCGHGQASCTKSVSVSLPGHVIKLDHNHQLFIDNVEIHKLPYQGNGIKIYMVSSLFMKAELSNGITILWDGRTRAYITAPSAFFNKTQGLCGTYDSNQKNDFKTLEGDIETDVNSFGNRMKVNPQCADMKPGEITDACEANAQRKPQAQQYCGYLQKDFFKACHSVVDVSNFQKDCEYDMCACTENLRDCLCPMIGEYAKQCAANGINVLWRNHIPECQIPCNGGQVYQVCPNECVRTCSNIALDPDCVQSKECAEGCGCPANQTLNDEGECIPIKECPCTFGGNEYPAGFLTKMEDKICTCRNARWECTVIPTIKAVTVEVSGKGNTTVTPPRTTKNPYLDNIKDICDEKLFQEYTPCMSDCPLTCQNMHGPAPSCPAPTECTKGCKCKDGYVLEGKQCVLQSKCPCYHGGQAYFEGDKIDMDCNQCTCKGQRWDCTNKECPAICSAVGDSHYHTFDGREYKFQGNCDYVLAKSTDSNSKKFLITENNVPCGTSGVTCTKSISFSIGEPGTKGFYRIQLVRGKPISIESGSPFNVSEVGESIMVTTPSGVTLVWDKGTRVYIKLRTEHKGKVEGLCGNFDGDQNNDFTTPQGGPPAIKAEKFGDSWKLHDYCGPPNNVTDTCEKAPHRKPWAQRKCGIISSDLFKPCHRHVPYQKYLEQCVFDACACDLGGDCECLCTAVAAYAHECALAGVPILWRTDEFCAIQCETCQKYNPCISVCPKKTCDNRLVYEQTIKDCKEEMCFEGCDLKPCPEGMVYDGTIQPIKCIPEAFCNNTACVINGRNYRQNEPILDETICDKTCEICYCDNGKIMRNGYCSTTPPVSTLSPKVIMTFSPSHSQAGSTMSPSIGITQEPFKGSTMTFTGIGSTSSPGQVTTKAPGKQNGDSSTPSPSLGTTQAPIRTNTTSFTGIGSTSSPGQVTTKAPSKQNGDSSTPSPSLGTTQAPIRTNTTSFTGIGSTSSPGQVTTKAPSKQNGDNSTPNPSLGPTQAPVLGSTGSITGVASTDVPDLGTTQFPPKETQGGSTQGPSLGSTQAPVKGSTASITGTGSTAVPGKVTTKTPPKQNGEGPTTTNAPDLRSTLTPGHVTGSITGTGSTNSPGVVTTQVPPKHTPQNGDGHTGPPTFPPKCLTNGWTGWMSASHPSLTNSGDIETISELRKKYVFCDSHMLTAIQCRVVGTSIMSADSGQKVTCDLKEGLSCFKTQQENEQDCYDYEVRYDCDCGLTTLTTEMTPTPSPTTSPTQHPVKTLGQITGTGTQKPPIGRTESPTPGTGTQKPPVGSTESPTPGTGTQKPPIGSTETPTQGTGTQKPPVGSTKSLTTGTGTQKPPIGSTESPTPGTGTQKPPVGSTESPTPGTSKEQTTQGPYLTHSGSPPPYVCVDGWSKWMNIDKPTVKNPWEIIKTGDMELMSELRYHHSFCAKPTAIKCRTVDDHKPYTESSDDKVSCDLIDGLVCSNANQGGRTCSDYEVSVYCDCGESTPKVPPVGSTLAPEPSTTPIPGVPYQPTPSCMWTQWMNSHTKLIGSKGEYETISNLRMKYAFCEHPVKIECRDIASKMSYDKVNQQGVTCDINRGLTCDDINQNSGACLDYEVRVYCVDNCPSVSPTPGPFITPTASPGTGEHVSPTASPVSGGASIPTASPGASKQVSPTASPPAELCVEGWTDWINAHSPLGTTGDVEQPTDIPGYPETCNEVIAAQCIEASSGDDYKKTGQNVNCNVKGLTCINDKTQNCMDYKARFYCLCKKPTARPPTGIYIKPTAHPTSDHQGIPSLHVTPSSGTIVCDHGWTQEMNTDNPNDGGNGDYETIPNLRKKYAFCAEENIITARCYKAGTNITHDHTGETVSCDRTGLKCNNWEQLNQSSGKCSDYSIRFYCNCKFTTSALTSHPVPTKPSKDFSGPTKPSTDFSGPTKPTTNFRVPTKTTTPVGMHLKATTGEISGTGKPITAIPLDYCKTMLGVQDGSIFSYDMFSASSSKGSDSDAFRARLNGPRAWEARYTDSSSEYIQIDLGEPLYTAGIRLQGNPNKDMWVTKYKVATSLDGQSWSVIQDKNLGIDAVFAGSSDRNTAVDSMFDGYKGDNEIRVHFIRIIPVEFHGGISLRFEVLSCKSPSKLQITTTTTLSPELTPGTGIQMIPTAQPLCYEPMGIENSLLIKDSQLTGSSHRDKMTGAQYGRLQNEFGSWIPSPTDMKPWIIVDMLQPKLISGILTQGSAKEEKWITKFHLMYSIDGLNYQPYSPFGQLKEFSGNNDKNSVAKHILPRPLTTRFLKIVPTEGGPNGMGLRFNLLGCFYFIPPLHHHTTSIVGTKTVSTVSPGTGVFGTPTAAPTPFPTKEPLCVMKMGIESYMVVGKPQLTVSSSKDSFTGANHGRLNPEEKKPTAWIPSPQDKTPYIQVNFLEPKTITGVIVTGHGQLPQWTKTFTVLTSTDGKNFKPYNDKENSTDAKIFPGNKNNTQPETYLFNRKIVAQYVRIYPGEYTGAPAIRFNLLGCNPPLPRSTLPPTLPPGVTTVSPSAPNYINPTAKPKPGEYIEPPKVCLLTMGVESSLIVDNSQITASSHESTSTPQAGRLYGEGAWVPKKTDTKPWIQIDFLQPKLLSGVITQGHGQSQNWVKSYQIFTSIDGKTFIPYNRQPGDTTPKTFSGNTDSGTPIRHLFNRNITAQVIRLYPVESNLGTPALRWNVIGCTPDIPKPPEQKQGIPIAHPTSEKQGSPGHVTGSATNGQTSGTGPQIRSTGVPSTDENIIPTPQPFCEIPMGLSNKFVVTDSQLTASSKLNQFSGAERGRIFMDKDGSFTGGWIPSVNNKKQWIQVDLITPHAVTGIVTQGQTEKPLWVTKYAVYYSTDGENFFPVPKSPLDKTAKEFTGNTNQFTPVKHLFPQVKGRYFRIYPLEWHTGIGMRFNLLGCQSPIPPHLTTTPKIYVTGSRSSGPSSCMYWTPWVSTATPDKTGEYETIYNLNQLVHSCQKENMKKIECRDMDSHVSHDQTGETGVKCDLTTVGGLLCKNADQPDNRCKDYEIRVFCDECPTTVSPTPEVTKTTPSPKVGTTESPRPCQNKTYWSPWVDKHKPDTSGGESEFMSAHEITAFCPYGKISNVDCTTLDGTDYTANMEIATCTIDEGFVCDGAANGPFPCSDYRIRYECEEVCLITTLPPTTTPSPTPKVTESPTPKTSVPSSTEAPTPGTTEAPLKVCTTSGWGPWINRDKPGFGGGDHEFLTPEELQRFCYGGKVTTIGCAVDSENYIPYESSGEIVGYCDKDRGFICRNADNFPITCSDYKIRYFCNCSNPTVPTTPEVPVTVTTQKPSPGKLTYPRCAWSDWLSSTAPTAAPTSGDMETIENLKKRFGLCPNIVDIECRVIDNGSGTSAAQDSVTCDIQNGLRCYNRDQLSFQCHDYEVRVKCWDSSCNPGTVTTGAPVKSTSGTPTSTVSLFPKTTTTSICAPGEILESCAYKCGDLCDNMVQLVDACKDNSETCVPLCRPPVQKCAIGEKLKDKITCVQQSMCPCKKQDGTTAQPNEKWTNPKDECSVCQCFNNTVTCIKDETCSTIAPTPYTPVTITHPCNWTYWINVDTPLTGEGDIETISKIRTTNIFCNNPVQIECRDVKSQGDYKARGQAVTCDLNTGLKCLNFENGGKCEDYEVRFFCPCASAPTTTTTTTLAPPTDLYINPTAAPFCGWTKWLNTDNPFIMKEGKMFEGDIESISNIRKMHPLCEYYMMTNVECRDSETKVVASKTGEVVTCDRIRGLRCKNDQQKDGKCLDYEIRVFCDCYGIPQLHHHTTPSPTPTQLVTKPIINACGWTTWLNGHTPDVHGEMERFTDLRKYYRFCDVEAITGIECRQAGTKKTIQQAGQMGVVCDLGKGGLLCSNTNQASTGGKCFDYEIRIFCEPKELDCHATTLAPPTDKYATPTPAPTTDIFGNPIPHTKAPTPGESGTPTAQPTPGESGKPTAQPTPGESGKPTAEPTKGVSGNPTAQPTPGESGKPTAEPTKGVSGNPTAQPTPGESGKPTAEPTKGVSGNPTAQPTPGESGKPTAQPTPGESGKPTAQPTPGESGKPTAEPTKGVSGNPTAQPTPGESGKPTAQPTPGESGKPTAEPTKGVSGNPTAQPTPGESGKPTAEPTKGVSGNPTAQPTPGESGKPTAQPTPGESGKPTAEPTKGVSGNPTAQPTPGESGKPTAQPTPGESGKPTAQPTPGESGKPTAEPTKGVSGNPTAQPTPGESGKPTAEPTKGVSGNPTAQPTPGESGKPTAEPTKGVSGNPTAQPTPGESGKPTAEPTKGVFGNPTTQPPYECTEGMTIGTPLPMKNEQMTVSSSLTPTSGPDRSHLTQMSHNKETGGWVAGSNSPNEFIMINFKKQMLIDGITTKGQAGQPSWITSFKVFSSTDGKTFEPYKENGKQKVLSANFDSETPVHQQFHKPIYGQYVKLVPVTWNGAIALRWQLYGCTGIQIVQETTVSPIPGKTGVPTASPTGEINKSPTPSPTGEINISPTASPTEGINKSPTASPTGEINISPTASPTEGINKSPTASPTEGINKSPTASPTTGVDVTPTASPTSDVNGSPTPSATGFASRKTTSGTSHVTCTDGWSDWINKDTPDTGDGDHEVMTAVEKMAFCKDGKIMDVECATKDGTPYDSTGEIATCYTDTGFICNNMDNDFTGGSCSDYKIRYKCKCAEPATTVSPIPGEHKSPTASPTGITQSTPTPAPTSFGQSSPTPAPTKCVTRWSTWINRDRPTTNNGDYENLTPDEIKKFCPGGTIKKVECQTSSGIPFESTGAIQHCSVERGLICNNADNFPVGCDDYSIKYFCVCSESPTTAGHISPTLSPTLVPVTPTNNIPVDCKTALGMENEGIRAEMISASSSRSPSTRPENARLNGPTAWVAGVENKNQYVQVNFLQPTYVTGVTTQGRPTVPSYVTSYFVMFSSDGVNWNTYMENGQKKQFNGNFDSLTAVTHYFTSPIRAQYIRINPQTFYTKMAMRFEIQGCFVPYPTAKPTPSPTTPPTQTTTVSFGVPTKPPTPPKHTINIEECTQWDQWVNLHSPAPGGNGDREPIDEVKKHSPICQNPMKIECLTATGAKPDDLGQIVTCDLWHGLECDNMNQFSPSGCDDYKVRLACLKHTPECIPPTPVISTQGAHHTTRKIPVTPIKNIAKCYEEMNTDNCPPSCPTGLYCDGQKCVQKSECTCMIHGQIVMPNHIVPGPQCSTCQCVNGESKCIPKSCPPCQKDESKYVNVTTCECTCKTCADNEFRCGNNMCIPKPQRCDGVIDCNTDEINCPTRLPFTPPNKVTPSPTPSPTTLPPTYRPCVNGWSQWVDENNPSTYALGDREKSSSEYQKATGFCYKGTIKKVECWDTDIDAAHFSSGATLRCNPRDGLICSNADNFPIPCDNYKIRYQCECGPKTPQYDNTTTTTPAPVSNVTGHSVPDNYTRFTHNPTPCVAGWSPYINENHPDAHNLGDREKTIRQYKMSNHSFCRHGKVTKAECWDVEIDAPHYSSGAQMTCTPENGLVCNNADNFPIQCDDYKIRFYCECESSTKVTIKPTQGTVEKTATVTTAAPHTRTTASPGTHVSGHTTEAPGTKITRGPSPGSFAAHTTKAPKCVQEWSPYINENHPDGHNLGDKEINAVEYKIRNPSFCPYGIITKAECWDIEIDAPHYSSGAQMACSAERGLICNNADNFPIQCDDYKIRFFCRCAPTGFTMSPTPGTGTRPTTTLAPNTRTTASPTPGTQSVASTPAPCDLSKCQPLVKPLLKEGEELMVVKTTDGCCNKYTVICKPEKCITQPPTCTSPKVIQQTNTGECCPQYKCECPIPCPTMATPVCKPDSHYTVIETECNCQAYACVRNIINGTVPPPIIINQVCKYNKNGQEMVKQPGDIWQDGPCKACQCLKGTDGNAVTSCQTQTCPSCKLGEVLQDLPGECCGRCMPSGCVVNATVYKEGQSIPSSKKCYSRSCGYMSESQTYYIMETSTICMPDFKLPTCPGNITLMDLTGCCPKCVVKPTAPSQVCSTCQPRLMFRNSTRSVGFFKVTTATGLLCQNKEPVDDLMECSGSCSSTSRYTAVMQGFDNNCNCCQPQSTETKRISLSCEDGTVINKTYTMPKSCGCSACGASQGR